MKQLITTGVSLILAGNCFADTWTVDDDGLDYPKADYSQLSDAINVASEGDTIHVYPGTYSYIYVNKSLFLIGVAGPDVTVIDANYSAIAFHLAGGDTYVEGLTFTKGYTSSQDYGSGAYISGGTIQMKNCLITKCRTYNGYGLKVASSNCVFEDVLVQGNVDSYSSAYNGAGVGVSGSNTTFTRCRIENNAALKSNSGDIYGGGIYCTNQQLHLEECVISGNTITSSYDSSNIYQALGSGIYSSTYPFYMDNTIVCGNIALYNNGAQGMQVYGGFVGSGNVIGNDCDTTGSVAGACCLETECTLATAYDCGVAGGTYKGMLTTCEQVDCLDDGNFGACCVDGNCAPSTQYVCDSLGGAWQGKFTTCQNVVCELPPAIAACCLSDDCLTTVETICQTLGGTWQGDNSDCNSATCEPWIGACCVSGSCLDVTLVACYEASGSYSGDLTVCDNTECSGACYGDLNADGTVNVVDVLGVIAAWGACP